MSRVEDAITATVLREHYQPTADELQVPASAQLVLEHCRHATRSEWGHIRVIEPEFKQAVLLWAKGPYQEIGQRIRNVDAPVAGNVISSRKPYIFEHHKLPTHLALLKKYSHDAEKTAYLESLRWGLAAPVLTPEHSPNRRVEAVFVVDRARDEQIGSEEEHAMVHILETEGGLFLAELAQFRLLLFDQCTRFLNLITTKLGDRPIKKWATFLEIVGEVLREIARHFVGQEVVLFFCVVSSAGRRELVVTWAVHKTQDGSIQIVTAPITVPIGIHSGVTGHAAATCDFYLVQDIASEERVDESGLRYQEHPAFGRMASALACPIMRRDFGGGTDDVLGVIAAESRHPYAFGHAEYSLLKLLAG